MKISEMITDRYKLRIPPTVYYELLADVQEVEEEQEPTTKNDLAVDCISREEVLKLMKENWHTHNGDWAMQESMDDIRALPVVTPQEPKTGEWQQDLDGTYLCSECGSGFKEQPTLMGKPMFSWCPLCGCRMVEPQESEDT